MKKVLLVFLTVILLTGCNIRKNDNYYKKIADTIISFYRNDNYNRNDFSTNDRNIMDKYLSTLTHKNQTIDLTPYLENVKKTVNDKNTKGIYKENNKYYIKYSDLVFNNSKSDIESYATVICDGKVITLFYSEFYPNYSVTKSDKVYDYIYTGSNISKDVKKYAYRSSYDKSGVVVVLNIKNNDLSDISVSYENVDNFVNTNNNASTFSIIIRIIMIIIILGFGGFIIYKSYKKSNL